jgi:hypothetical protein
MNNLERTSDTLHQVKKLADSTDAGPLFALEQVNFQLTILADIAVSLAVIADELHERNRYRGAGTGPG